MSTPPDSDTWRLCPAVSSGGPYLGILKIKKRKRFQYSTFSKKKASQQISIIMTILELKKIFARRPILPNADGTWG